MYQNLIYDEKGHLLMMHNLVRLTMEYNPLKKFHNLFLNCKSNILYLLEEIYFQNSMVSYFQITIFHLFNGVF